MEFKKMYRTIAPQLREDLLFFHAATRMSGLQPLTREAANVGFEAILQSFWTGFQIWNDLKRVTAPGERGTCARFGTSGSFPAPI